MCVCVAIVVREGTDFFFPEPALLKKKKEKWEGGEKKNKTRSICSVTGATRQTGSAAWSSVTNRTRAFVGAGVSPSAVVTRPCGPVALGWTHVFQNGVARDGDVTRVIKMLTPPP